MDAKDFQGKTPTLSIRASEPWIAFHDQAAEDPEPPLREEMKMSTSLSGAGQKPRGFLSRLEDEGPTIGTRTAQMSAGRALARHGRHARL